LLQASFPALREGLARHLEQEVKKTMFRLITCFSRFGVLMF